MAALVQPDGLSERGAAMFVQLQGDWKLEAADRVLLEEACRIADRLERLDRVLVGDLDAWLSFDAGDGDKPVVVVVNSVLGEARQQANTLRLMLAQLKPAKAAASDDSGEPEKPGGPTLDEIRARREQRQAPKDRASPD